MRALPARPATTLPASLLGAALALLSAAGCEASGPQVDEERQLEIHTESAAGYLGMGEYERAIDQAMRGLELDPGNFTLRLYLGRGLLARGGTQDVLNAETIFRELSLDEDFRVPMSLAETLERKGVAYDEAARGVATGERFTQAADPLARAEELRREAVATWEESYGFYVDANELQPNDPEVLNGLVRVTALLGRDEESLTWAEAILTVVGSDRGFWENQIQRPEISATEEERIRVELGKLTRLQVAVLLQAATTAVQLDRREAAVDYLSRVIELEPDLAEAHSRRAQLLIEFERYEEALAAIDTFIRLTKLEFEHPYVRKAFELRRACELQLERAAGGTGG